jgi:hypothetical protein
MITANFLAPLILGMFPLFVLGLFLMYRPAVAVMVSLLAAEMFLPPVYALPITPSWLTKWTLPPFAAGLLALFFARRQLRGSRPFRGVEGIFAIGIIVDFMTYWTNRDDLHYGPLVLPGENFKDLSGDIIRSFGDPWVVFFLGRTLFKTSRDLKALCRMLAISVLVYSLPILFEIRMSPNLNRWIYGFQASNFDMTVRWGGFRPTVFFKDGLPLASFVLTGTVMALSMARNRMRLAQLSMKTWCIYMLFILVICKSTGMIVYALLVAPIVYFSPPKRSTMVASALVLCFLIYPFLRFTDAIPVKPIVNLFTGVSAERAGSLLFRFDMEQRIMDLTMQRPWWGWGAWGRNLVFDPWSGRQLSIPDGAVIITLSTHGVVGFLSYFFPFAYTVLRARKLIKTVRSRSDRLLLGALAINCAVILFDLIVNSAFFPVYMLLFGALYSLPTGIIAEEAAKSSIVGGSMEPDFVPARAEAS